VLRANAIRAARERSLSLTPFPTPSFLFNRHKSPLYPATPSLPPFLPPSLPPSLPPHLQLVQDFPFPVDERAGASEQGSQLSFLFLFLPAAPFPRLPPSLPPLFSHPPGRLHRTDELWERRGWGGRGWGRGRYAHARNAPLTTNEDKD